MAVACPNMSIVVIVPYHNESKSIEKTLDSIDSQSMKPNSVILVDSGSTDMTSQIINDWINKKNTKLFKNIYSGEMSPSSSINLGIKSSEEKIIAYVDCGLDIPSNWLMSSIAQMKKDNSDMVSIRIFTDGSNIIDKSFIAQTYGFKNNQICLPGSLIKRNVFDLIGLFLNKVRASYDTDFIKKFHQYNLKRSINDKVILKYFGINYTNSLLNGAKKVYSYSLDAWNATGDMKPIIYIVFTIVSLITFFLQPKIFDYYDMHLVFTGVLRNSTMVLKNVSSNIQKSLPLLEILEKAYFELINNNFDKFIFLIAQSWEKKKKTSQLIVENKIIKDLDKYFLENESVISHKLCGAGNGGFFLLFSKKDKLKINQRSVKIMIESNGVSGRFL